MIGEAQQFATAQHAGQFRKDRVTPYITHPSAVAQIVKGFGCDEETQASAWLHDVVEDTNASLEEITQRFGSNVARYVCQLTRSEGETHEEYARRIIYGSDLQTQYVKIADVLHNLSTLDSITSADVRQKAVRNKVMQCERYYLPLAKERSAAAYTQMTAAVENAKGLLKSA